MNRDHRNSFGRRLTCASTSPVPPTADASLLVARPHNSTGEAGVTGQSVSRLIGLISGSFEEVSAFGWLEQIADIAESLAERVEGSGCLLSQPRLEF